MYMSINHGETDDFKEHGRVAMRKKLREHRPNDVWTNYF
jgi:hypothetical protein